MPKHRDPLVTNSRRNDCELLDTLCPTNPATSSLHAAPTSHHFKVFITITYAPFAAVSSEAGSGSANGSIASSKAPSNTIRRFSTSADTTFKEFTKLLRKEILRRPEGCVVVAVSYKDSDGDVIEVTNEMEWREAISHSMNRVRKSRNPVIPLNVTATVGEEQSKGVGIRHDSKVTAAAAALTSTDPLPPIAATAATSIPVEPLHYDPSESSSPPPCPEASFASPVAVQIYDDHKRKDAAAVEEEEFIGNRDTSATVTNETQHWLLSQPHQPTSADCPVVVADYGTVAAEASTATNDADADDPTMADAVSSASRPSHFFTDVYEDFDVIAASSPSPAAYSPPTTAMAGPLKEELPCVPREEEDRQRPTTMPDSSAPVTEMSEASALFAEAIAAGVIAIATAVVASNSGVGGDESGGEVAVLTNTAKADDAIETLVAASTGANSIAYPDDWETVDPTANALVLEEPFATHHDGRDNDDESLPSSSSSSSSSQSFKSSPKEDAEEDDDDAKAKEASSTTSPVIVCETDYLLPTSTSGMIVEVTEGAIPHGDADPAEVEEAYRYLRAVEGAGEYFSETSVPSASSSSETRDASTVDVPATAEGSSSPVNDDTNLAPRQPTSASPQPTFVRDATNANANNQHYSNAVANTFSWLSNAHMRFLRQNPMTPRRAGNRNGEGRWRRAINNNDRNPFQDRIEGETFIINLSPSQRDNHLRYLKRTGGTQEDDVEKLRAICPDATRTEIADALSRYNGQVYRAANYLMDRFTSARARAE